MTLSCIFCHRNFSFQYNLIFFYCILVEDDNAKISYLTILCMTSALIKFCLHNDIPIYATLNFCLNNNIPFLFLRFHRPAFYREQHSEMYSVILYSFVYFLVEVSSERLMARFRRFMYCFRIFRTVLTECFSNMFYDKIVHSDVFCMYNLHS